MISILRISIFLAISLLAGGVAANGDKTAATRFGTLAITGDIGSMSLFFNGKKLSADADSLGMSFRDKYDLGDKDTVLVIDEVSATCQLYFFITVAGKADVKISSTFGTCDDSPKIVRSGEKIVLRMKDTKGRNVKYIFENDVISENGKILKAQ
ncbi:hypothetical protein [Collimonas fungivorans]|nr:hypothetical protein [Collimonas fungivorans]